MTDTTDDDQLLVDVDATLNGGGIGGLEDLANNGSDPELYSEPDLDDEDEGQRRGTDSTQVPEDDFTQLGQGTPVQEPDALTRPGGSVITKNGTFDVSLAEDLYSDEGEASPAAEEENGQSGTLPGSEPDNAVLNADRATPGLVEDGVSRSYLRREDARTGTTRPAEVAPLSSTRSTSGTPYTPKPNKT